MKGIVSCIGLMILAVSVTSAQQTNTAKPSTTDLGWPRQITKSGNTLLYYQPQLDEWKDKKTLRGKVAISVTPKGGRQALGVASFETSTLVDKEKRTVFLRDITLLDIRFPTLSGDTLAMIRKITRDLAPTGGETISLDRVLADLKESKTDVKGVQVSNDPPKIFYSATPAILLVVDGDPALAPIDQTELEFVINTNWDLFKEKKKSDYYLLVENSWFTSTDLKGPWMQTFNLPKEMTKIPAGQNYDEIKKRIPPPAPSGTVPQIFFSDKPAELIVTKGAPVYSKINGTGLLYVTNTDNDIFLDDSKKIFYTLLSGRWFRSAEFSGPWTFAGEDLPADFTNIPPSSPMGSVRASVPGTLEASDAVMLAQIPTTAVVNRKEAESKATVHYDGDPQFKPIENTSMQYAVNTQEKVLKVGDLYYLCFQAVWFVSTSPTGPWKTADSVPQEVYSIPSSSPVYNVTYVTQTNPTEETVESSSTGGYFGMFVLGVAIGATICYGTGYYYPPYFYYPPGMYYPIYRPYPVTYGVGAIYNPYTGGYAVGRSVYGPYGSAHSSAWYNPSTGRYGRSASVQGWYGGRTVASSYNPWTGGYARTSQGHNAYGQWGSSVATRGDQWVQTGHVTTANGTTAGFRTSSGNQGIYHSGDNGRVIKTDNGVYAGHDGNVYKKNTDGTWSKNNGNGSWESINKPTATQQGLDRSAEARQRGQAQTRQYNTQRNIPTAHNFGGGGAGRFGGGGFRRR